MNAPSKPIPIPQLGKDVNGLLHEFQKGQWIIDSLPEWKGQHKTTFTPVLKELQRVTYYLRRHMQPVGRHSKPAIKSVPYYPGIYQPVDWAKWSQYKIMRFHSPTAGALQNRGELERIEGFSWTLVDTVRGAHVRQGLYVADPRLVKQ